MPYLEKHGEEKMMEPSFEKFLVKLADDKVRFILVGGLAVSLNGYVRLTEYVDILIDLAEDNVSRLIKSLGGFGEGYGGELKHSDLSPEPGAVRIIEEAENCQVDIFSIIGGFLYKDLSEACEIALVAGRSIKYASKSQLVRIKSTSVREKDQLDVSALRALIDNPEAFD